MLAGKTRGRQIFGCRRTSHGDSDAGPGLPFKLPIRLHNLFAERCRVHRLVDDFAGFGGCGSKPLDLAFVETVEKLMKFVRNSALQQRIAIGVRYDGKAIWNSHPFGRESRIQLAKRRGLAANKPDVVQSDFEERFDISFHGTNKSRRILPRIEEGQASC